MQNTLINLNVSSLFEIKDYENEVNLVHFRDQYYKVQEILKETDRFYFNFVKSKLKPLQYYWKNPYITSAIKPYSIKVYKNIVDPMEDKSVYNDTCCYTRKKTYNDIHWEALRIKAEVMRDILKEIKEDKSCPFYFPDDYAKYNDNFLGYVTCDTFNLEYAKLKIGDYPLNSRGEINLWKNKNSLSEERVKDNTRRLAAAKENGFMSQDECKEAISKYKDIYRKRVNKNVRERFNDYLLNGDLTNKFIVGVKLDDLTQIVYSLCNDIGIKEYLKLITPKYTGSRYVLVSKNGDREELKSEEYIFKSEFWAKKVEHNYDSRYSSEDKNDYNYLQLNTDFNIKDFFDETYTLENFIDSNPDYIYNPLKPSEDCYSGKDEPLINYEKVQQFVDEYMKPILEKVYDIIYRHPKSESTCKNKAMYIMYKGTIRYVCAESEIPHIKVSISKDGKTLDCKLSRTSGHSAWGKHTDTHHNTSFSFDIYTNELVKFSDDKYTTSYGIDMDIDDFD